MNKKECIHDLEAIKEYFKEEHDGSYPLCIDEAIGYLKKDDVLDNVRAEINQLSSYVDRFAGGAFAIHIDKEKVLKIIDKYRKGEKE